MEHRRGQHPNAVLTPEGRRRMVRCVVESAWTVEATAERFQVDPKTVRKWRDRFLAEGPAGLEDRSSRPHRSPSRTRRSSRRKVISLRRRRRWGAARIANHVGIAPSTAQHILNDAGLGRLDRGDRASAEPKPAPRRYQRERPGELVHVDVKKIAAIPSGGGWRMHGRGQRPRHRVGYRYIHTAVDDRSRLAYSEILANEQGKTAALFWLRAIVFFAAHGVPVERVITDNGSCYRSRHWAQACRATSVTHKRTRPYRPQTNGKVERFHRILLEEWAYIRDWTSETQRARAYNGFIHFYNHHRPHGALGWSTPRTTLTQLLRDNLTGQHS
jgi:transposase InsO family protein